MSDKLFDAAHPVKMTDPLAQGDGDADANINSIKNKFGFEDSPIFLGLEDTVPGEFGNGRGTRDGPGGVRKYDAKAYKASILRSRQYSPPSEIDIASTAETSRRTLRTTKLYPSRRSCRRNVRRVSALGSSCGRCWSVRRSIVRPRFRRSSKSSKPSLRLAKVWSKDSKKSERRI